MNLDIIGIADHNSTYHAPLIKKLGAKAGIYVLMGTEVTTREDVHCLTFFENETDLNFFQKYIDANLPFIRNKPELLGYQVVVDEQEHILREVPGYLGVGLDQSIDEVRLIVREMGGIFIPAHVDRPRYGVISQLGFLPDDLQPDAIEIFGIYSKEDFLARNPDLGKYTLIKSSDSHTLAQLGKRFSEFILEEASFSEIKMALDQKNGREVRIE
jgi:PHP family Zn ribbon phosphoesterase